MSRTVPATGGSRPIPADHYLAHRRAHVVFADGGFAGRFVAWAHDITKTTVEIVRKRPGQHRFEVPPKRRVAERTLAWITAHRRLARDHERKPAISETFIHWAMIRTMLRRVTRRRTAPRWTARQNGE